MDNKKHRPPLPNEELILWEITQLLELAVRNSTFSNSQWLTGNGVPSSALGNSGDFYLDLTNNTLYEKQAGGWVLIATLGGASFEARYTENLF